MHVRYPTPPRDATVHHPVPTRQLRPVSLMRATPAPAPHLDEVVDENAREAETLQAAGSPVDQQPAPSCEICATGARAAHQE